MLKEFPMPYACGIKMKRPGTGHVEFQISSVVWLKKTAVHEQ